MPTTSASKSNSTNQSRSIHDTYPVGQAMLGHGLGALVCLVAETQGPLADHHLLRVVLVVEGRRRAARFRGDVGDGRRQDALARDDRSGGQVDRGVRAPPAARREVRPAVGLRLRHPGVPPEPLEPCAPGTNLNLMLDSD